MATRKRIRNNIVLYSVFLVLLICIYFFVIPNQIRISIAAKADSFSPDTFPKIIVRIMIAISAVGLFSSLIALNKDIKVNGKRTRERKPFNQKNFIQNLIPYVVVILILLYIICFKKIGFIPSTIFFPLLILYVIGGRNWKHYVIYLLFAFTMFVLFKYIMLVPLR